MANFKIAVLPGDGIGPEITAEAVKVLTTAKELYSSIDFSYETFDVGAEKFLREGVAMTEEAFTHCRDADAIFMGAIGLPEARYPDGREVNGDVIFRLRFDLDLYAGVRPVKFYEGVPSVLGDAARDIDYVIVRENVEGLYASRTGGCRVRDELTTDTIVITREGTSKVSNYAFRLAEQRRNRGRAKDSLVTCVDKANVLRSYAFFREVFDDVSKGYPYIPKEHVYVDAMTAFQVQTPGKFDVVVAENMFGDIISDLSAATVGGLGMAASGDIGDHYGMFQPAHGTAPSIAGKNIANPLATILSAGMMLDWLGTRHQNEHLVEAAALVERAVEQVVRDSSALTSDLGGTASTDMVGTLVSEKMVELRGRNS